jgi:hypothetical protein
MMKLEKHSILLFNLLNAKTGWNMSLNAGQTGFIQTVWPVSKQFTELNMMGLEIFFRDFLNHST